MKVWYYFIGAGILSGAVAIWKFRHKILKLKYQRLKFDYDFLKNLRKLNANANSNYQKAGASREDELKKAEFDNPNDHWAGLRKSKED